MSKPEKIVESLDENDEINSESSLFIRTAGAISRIKKVVDGIKSGIPLLLEGETGTSKTATAKCAAKEIKQHVILFNFSSQTTVEDLLGRISKSSDAWGGFSFKKGPFTEAFEKGYCIILDEINLAHETVLQCIQASLDSRTLSLDFSGSEVDKTIQMHSNFHIIATQNPLTSKFSQKRNFLSHNFTSRFQIINFGQIDQDELVEIATGLSKNIDSITPEFINALVQFHFLWPKNKYSFSYESNKDTENSSPANYVFTIREICRTIKSIEKGLTPFESILVNYGSRYNQESQAAMKELLSSLGIKEEYKFFESSFYIEDILNHNTYMPETKIVTTNLNSRFYLTDILSQGFSTCFHLLDNYQPILLVGPNGCGKTSIGRWIGDLYASHIIIKERENDEDDDDNRNVEHDYKFFICNPEMTISDIIGRYLPNKQTTSGFSVQIHSNKFNTNYSDAPIEWMYGPVVKAMINGDCLILDQIDTAPSTILERLNSLFDGLGEKNFKFPIQENLENPEVLVDPKFRIIATSSLSGLNDLSPAFLNRFTVIYINEQLNSINDQLPQFIRCISPYASKLSSGKKEINYIANEVTAKLSKDNILTSLNLSKCVNGFFKLKNRFPDAKNDSILKFCFDACIYHTTNIPQMDNEFIDILLESLGEDDRKDTEFDVFHFKEAQSTRQIMATLVACSVIGLHTILVGRTGSGKTTAALAFSRMNKFSSKTSSTHIIAFNGETQLDELYGYFTIDKGNFDLHQGELSQAMSEGEVFIADELNLADQQIIQSLNVAIEPFSGENIILPVTGSSIQIKEGFFFIGCQNDLTMNGRRPIPESIKKKILCINYPENSPDDLEKICKSISDQFNFDRAIAKYVASLIEKMKENPKFKPWSLREVRTLFRRIAYFKTKGQDIRGFTSLHHASFMLASSYQNHDDMINEIAEIVCAAFRQKSMKKSLIKDLKADIKVEKYIDHTFDEKDNDDDDEEDDDDDDDDFEVHKKKKSKDKNKSHYRIKLKKGTLELNISNTQLLDIPENIQTLWRTVFDIYLTTQSEPLLFNGPSGFKTYLSELFCSLAPAIYLHSDSTISSLVGQIALLDRYQAKLSLLEALDDFTGHNMKLKQPLNEIKKYLEENDDINEDLLDTAVDQIKLNVPESFIPIIENVSHRLIEIQKEERDIQNNVRVVGNRMFSNYISLFKPGLITKSIFCQNSLILKNFAQPPPTVIERFNELLSVTPTLTLFEDTTNTFTTPANNKIFGFSNVFRIIAICLPPEKRNLSDAMLSRLTEIYVPSYNQEEQESVFKTYLEKQFESDISLTIQPLKILKQALNAFERESFDLNISFRQKIKIIQVANQWQKKFPEMDVLTIYIISIMRCAGGPLPFELKQVLYDIMEKTFNPDNKLSEFPSILSVVYKSVEDDNQFYDSYRCTMDSPCLTLTNDGDTICSTLTNFTYPNISIMNNKLNDKQDLRFTFSNYDLIDVIFSFSIINYPLIIEGPNGCGKSSAFFYVAECLGVKVIQLSISRSATVEDLFGRFEPNAESENLQFDFKPTAFLNAIDSGRNSGDRYWILIEELHLASPSVIDALEPIFNLESDHITLPDGTFVQRGNFFIVGLLTKPLQKQSITNSALYYKVRNYTKTEFTEICKFILESNEYGGITKRICPILEKLYETSLSSQIKIPVTPREAHKFVKMMNAATQHPYQNNQLSDIEISQILFLGRFIDEDMKESSKQLLSVILKDQGFSETEEIPEFTTENGGSLLTSKKISMDVSMRTQSRHNEIDHLTTSERQLFEFLILNVQDYTPIIVQGPTASGKTFSIQLFADVLGKNLKVLQMNSEINSSYISGSYQPSKDLTPSDISELQNALSLLTNFSHMLPDKFQAKIGSNQINDWTPAEFTELKKCVSELLESSQHRRKKGSDSDDDDDDDDDYDDNKLIDENDISNAREFINKVNSSLLFFNHLNRNDSLIIKALTEGDWLLLDGIESSPSDFLDRLSTLLDDPPILNLYERGSGYVYSTNPEKSERSQKIHPDFRLFMTYNPVNSNANNVSSSFLSKCSLFSMTPIDIDLYDSAVLVSGIIEKCFFSFSTPSEISARIASFHLRMKEEGQKQLTCRTLLYISREISYKNNSEKIDLETLKEIIFNHYFQGHQDENYSFEQNKQLFNEVIDKEFEEKVDDNLLEKLQKIERNTSKACNSMINIINDLRNQLIRIVNTKNDDELPKFKYSDFFTNLNILQLKDLDQIVNIFRGTMKYIRDNINEFTREQISCLASVTTVFDLINQIKMKTTGESAKIQSLFLDSDFIRNYPAFSTVLFQIQAFTNLYHRGLFMEEIPDVLIDIEFTKNYFQLFKLNELGRPSIRALAKLKNSPYSKVLKIPDDLDSFNYGPYEWNKKVSPLQKLCCSLFKCKKCRYLFTGLMKDLFIFTYGIFKKANIALFVEWINWLDLFFKAFKNHDFNIPFDEFQDQLQRYKDAEETEIVEVLNKIEKLRAFTQNIDLEDPFVQSTKCPDLFNLINDVYDSLKEKFLEIAENTKVAKDFFDMKERLSKLTEKNDNPLKRPYQLLYSRIESLSSNISAEDFNHINGIFKSIAQPSTKKGSKQNMFQWPTNQNLSQVEEKRQKHLEALISYSIELEKVDTLEKSPKWMTICDLSEPDYLLEEFFNQKSISITTIQYYKSILRAQLLCNLFNSNSSYEYCNTQKIIKFFNQFNDRYKIFEDNWALIAQKLSQSYPADFCISIPRFTPLDVLSLLLNPLTRKKGSIFSEHDIFVPDSLIDDFNSIFEAISQDESLQTFEEVSSQIKIIVFEYAKNNYPDEYDKYLDDIDRDDFNDFYSKVDDNNILTNIKSALEQIFLALNLGDHITETFEGVDFQNLDFSDIQDVEKDNLCSYINRNPCSGFYISQFPEVKGNIKKILALCTDQNDRFPLGLFEFRIFSGIRCIQFQIPDEFPTDFAQEFQDFLYRYISSNLKITKSKFTHFSHFIGFLLSSVPNFITEPYYSEHLRNIIINLICLPKEKMLKQEIMNFFKRFLNIMIDKLGSSEWEKIIYEELKYENSKDDVIRFLTNPWRFALEDVDKALKQEYEMKEFDAQKAIKQIISMIQTLSSDRSIEKLRQNVSRDESELQEKLVQDYRNAEKNNEKESDAEKQLNAQWIEFSKYVKSYIEKIPTLTSTSVPASSIPLQSESSFDSFYEFFSKNLNSMPCRRTEVIAIIPKKQNPSTVYTLQYNHLRKTINIRFTVTGKVMLFMPPQNINSIQNMKMQCEGCDIKSLNLQYDHEVVKFKFSSMKQITENYGKFDQSFKLVQQNGFKGSDRMQIIQKIGQVKVLFGDADIETFIGKLNSLNDKYNIQNLNDLVSYFDRLKTDVLDLEQFTTIQFSIENMEKPHSTTSFLTDNLSNIILSAKNNLNKSNFEIFSDDYQKKHKFFTSESNEYAILKKGSRKLQLKPKDVKSYGIEVQIDDMNKIEASEKLLTPSIFKDGDNLNVTIAKIEVNCDPLVFGVDLSPLKIQLNNFTEEEIVCEFQQISEELPLPKYKNEVGFLIIEIPVESLCKDALAYAKKEDDSSKENQNTSPQAKKKSSSDKNLNNMNLIDIEKTFRFEGVMKLTTKENPDSSSNIQYSINLHYISLTAFISMKNDHYFAFNDEKTEIVPFLASNNSKIAFEKFLNQEIKNSKFLDNIYELKDNKAQKPTFSSTQNAEDGRICDIVTAFAKETKPENSYLSMDVSFGLTKDKLLNASLHMNTVPKNTKLPQLTVAIYSDNELDFSTKSPIINLGNLKRKVFFFVGGLNNSDKPIQITNVKLSADDRYNSIHANYDAAKNTATIPPNKYGYAICFFEAKYTGPVLFRNDNDTIFGTLTVELKGISQTIDFRYKISTIQIQEKNIKYCGNTNNYYYFNANSNSFSQCNLKNVNSDTIFRGFDKQILISPFSYSLYDKINSNPRVEYDFRRGTLSRLLYDITRPDKYEVFGFFYEQKKFMTVTVDKPEKIAIRDNNVYLLARIKDKPETFFPLFCPIRGKKSQFDLRNVNDGQMIYRYFFDFFTSFMAEQDIKTRRFYSNNTLDNMLDNTHFPSIYNISFVIDLIGKGRKNLTFREVVASIVRFTNCIEFKEHFDKVMEKFKNENNIQFYSFISALNELMNERFEYFQESQFYLQLPVPFNIIKKQQETILNKAIKENKIDSCKYVLDFSNKIKDVNDLEQKMISQYKDNGYTVTPILKWTEQGGLSASTTEELNTYKEQKNRTIADVKAINKENSNIVAADIINFIEFPEKTTITSLYQTFSDILNSTYILTFIIYSLKKSHKPLNRARTLLNQLIAIDRWQRETSGCFPYSSFTSFFNPAFQSMMARLRNCNFKTLNFELSTIDNGNNFVQIPEMKASINYTKFEQPGLNVNNNITEFKPIPKPNSNLDKNPNPNPNPDTIIPKLNSKENVLLSKKEKIKVKVKMISTFKKVEFEEINENTKEISDTQFIQYLIQEMVKKDINFNETFGYSKEATHFPEANQDINEIGTHNPRIDSFMEAANRLSDTLINGINKSINDSIIENTILNKKDSIYASILIDCTSTLSYSYKSGLVTLAIALANALTSIKIPYSIVLFCDSDFQYVLKNVDEDHDLIHFEKLLDTITIRRRMSDMSTAVIMAKNEVKCSDENRVNHAMFVLTDGLTYKIKLIEQWKNSVLDNHKMSAMFFFMDILNKQDQEVVHPLWDKFRDSIQNSKSSNAVIYTKTAEIYSGKDIFIEPFLKVLNFSIFSDDKTEATLAELPPPIAVSPENLVNLKNIIHKEVPDERKFFSQFNFSDEKTTKYTQIDLNLVQPRALEVFTAGIEEKSPESITDFLRDLSTSCSLSLFDQSLLQEIGTLIFPPNKPSQFTPSIKGSIFYFPGLIKFILTQGQDSKIFLEKKAGLIRSYSVFFVIDNSISCINPSTVSHAFQTIYTLLYPLSKIDIPSLNIIITTANGPCVLCSEKPTMMALDDNSPLWASLFAHLLNSHPTRSSFYSALINAYQMRIQQKSASSILFTITDGIYNFNERNKLNSIFESFEAINTIPITVGIGSDPEFIGLLTKRSIYAQNPRYIWPAVLYLFGKETRDFDTIKNAFSISGITQEKVNQLENYFTNTDKMFSDLFKELNTKLRKAAIFRNYYNEKGDGIATQDKIDDEGKGDGVDATISKGTNKGGSGETTDDVLLQSKKKTKNLEGFDLGKKGYYKGVNILIVVCWDCSCSTTEDPRINEDVLVNGIEDKRKQGKDKKVSLVKALAYFAIKTKIVKNYRDAITQLTSGIYNQVWIICGRMDGSMPENLDSSSNGANLINQFIDCVIEYWKLGGGVVFWTDNYPLTAEANIFLRKAKFQAVKRVPRKKKTGNDNDNKKSSSPSLEYEDYQVNFHIGGSYKGEGTLLRVNQIPRTHVANESEVKNTYFDGHETVQIEDGYEKAMFNHGLNSIFEGYTIASAIKGQEAPDEFKKHEEPKFANSRDIYPFRAFSKSSEDGFSSLYYVSPMDNKCGDVIIDCGFSKLFFELTEEGIDRYVKNIAVFMLQLEKKYINAEDNDPLLIRPPKFKFKINNKEKVDFRQYKENRKIDLVFLIDGTGSMRFFIDAVRDSCNDIANQCHEKFPDSTFRYGAVIYRDTIVTANYEKYLKKKVDEVEKCELDEDPELLYRFLSSVKTCGGGKDGPEDWVSGYQCLLHEMNWNEDSSRIVIHICDAPGHGTSFTSMKGCQKLVSAIPEFKPVRGDKQIFYSNLHKYNAIQEQQDAQFKGLIKEAAEKQIMFFCMNGNRKATYCFKQTKEFYERNHGLKFVIQNQFGFGQHMNDDQEDDQVETKELIQQVINIALSAIDIAVAVVKKGSSSSQEEIPTSEYETECNKQFNEDLNQFENDAQKWLKKKRANRKRNTNTPQNANVDNDDFDNDSDDEDDLEVVNIDDDDDDNDDSSSNDGDNNNIFLTNSRSQPTPQMSGNNNRGQGGRNNRGRGGNNNRGRGGNNNRGRGGNNRGRSHPRAARSQNVFDLTSSSDDSDDAFC